MLADRRGEVKGGVREGIEGVDVDTFELAPLLQISFHKNYDE